MSGNWIQKIENMHVCPCCKHQTVIYSINKHYQMIDGEQKWFISIKFAHPYKTNEDIRKLQTDCECFDECGGYFVDIPISEERETVSQNWY